MRVLLAPSGSINPINNLKGTTTLLRLIRAVELLEEGKYDILLYTPCRYTRKIAGLSIASQIHLVIDLYRWCG